MSITFLYLSKDPEVRVTSIIADMVERKFLRGMVGIGGKYGCEMCKAEAETKGGISWTYPQCACGDERTEEESQYYARFVNNCYKPTATFLHVIPCRVGKNSPDGEKKGILEDSAVYDMPHVDYIWGLPLDIFHLGYEGITKKMLERMFTKRDTVQSRKYLARLNHYYTKMFVFSETARKARKIKVANLKGNELGLITLSVLPVLALQVIDDKKPHW